MRAITVLDTASLLALVPAVPGPAAAAGRPAPEPAPPGTPAGRWRSADGTVRLTIRADGTYAGAVAGRRRSASGTYRVDGAVLTLRDDTGLRTAVTRHDDELEMAGHRLGRA
jgi:hypothetical protein